MGQTTPTASLKISLELSNKEWLLTASPDYQKPQKKTVPSGDMVAVENAVTHFRRQFKLPAETKVICCYEAGRDGFWVAWALRAKGYEVLVIDSASIEVNRRARRTKTDRVDGMKLLNLLLRHLGGEKHAIHIVNIPSREQEDQRRIHRERDRLKKERAGHLNRIGALLALHGTKCKVDAKFEQALEKVKIWDKIPLPENLREEIKREYQRLQLTVKQLGEIKQRRRQVLKAVAEAQKQQKKPNASKVPAGLSLLEYQQAAKVLALMSLNGVGEISAWKLVSEYYGWRNFKNRRQVGGLAGLGGTPYSSGDSEQEQGISKAGRPDMRSLLIELAWSWLRYQPDSKISRWFQNRCSGPNKRSRRRAIVAVARQLAVAFWRYLDQGLLPEGAKIKEDVLIGKVA